MENRLDGQLPLLERNIVDSVCDAESVEIHYGNWLEMAEGDGNRLVLSHVDKEFTADLSRALEGLFERQIKRSICIKQL